MFFSTKQAGASPHAPTESAPAAPVIAPRRGANLVIVQFTRWAPVGETAYQPGQSAGFSRRDADILIRKGVAREIVS